MTSTVKMARVCVLGKLVFMVLAQKCQKRMKERPSVRSPGGPPCHRGGWTLSWKRIPIQERSAR